MSNNSILIIHTFDKWHKYFHDWPAPRRWICSTWVTSPQPPVIELTCWTPTSPSSFSKLQHYSLLLQQLSWFEHVSRVSRGFTEAWANELITVLLWVFPLEPAAYWRLECAWPANLFHAAMGIVPCCMCRADSRGKANIADYEEFD